MKRYILGITLFIIFRAGYSQNIGDYRSINDGSWSSSANWEVYDGTSWISATDYPGQNSSPAEITIGNSVVLDVSPAFNLGKLIINGTLITDNSDRTLVISKLIINGSYDLGRTILSVSDTTFVYGTLSDGDDNGSAVFNSLIYIDATGSFSTANASAFTFGGGITNYGTFSKTGTGTITFSNRQTLNNAGSNAMTINGSITSNSKLTIINSTASITFGNAFTSNDSLWVNNLAQVIFSGAFTNNGVLTTNNSANITFSNTFNTTANVMLGGSADITFNNNFTITGAAVVTNQNTAGVTIAGTLNGTVAASTWTNDLNSTLIYRGTALAPMNTGTLNASAANNTVIYESTNNIFKNTTYHHLILRLLATAAGNVQRTLTANLTINGNLTIESLHGTYTNELNPAGYNLTIAGTTNINARGQVYDRTNGGVNTFGGKVTVAANGIFNTTASTTANTVVFQGGIENSGTFSTNVVTFNTNTQTVIPNASITFGGNAAINSNVIFENGAGTVTFSGTVTIANDIIMTNRNQNTNGLLITGILNGSNANSTFYNDNNAFLTYNNATVPMGTGVFDVDQTGNTIFYNLNGAQTVKSVNYYNLSVAQNVKTYESVSFTINGNLNIATGATFQNLNGGSYANTLTINGQLINAGTFRAYQSNLRYFDVIFNASGNVISGNGTFNFRNVTFNNPLAKNSTATGSLFLWYGTASNLIQLRNIGGELTFTAGTVYILGNSTDTIGYPGNGKITFYNLQVGNGGAQNVYASLGTEVEVTNNITFNMSATSYLNLNGNKLTVNGNFRTNGLLRGNNASTFILNGSGNPTSTIQFDNTTPGTTNVFRNVTINRNGGTVTFANAVVADTLKITNGTLSTASNVTVNNSYENNATLNHTGNTFTFNKAGSMTIGGTNTFYNVILAAGDTVINNSTSTIITNNLNGSAANSTWINNDNSLLTYRGAAAPMATGSLIATATGNTIDYNAGGGQAVKGTNYHNLTFSNAGAKTLQAPTTVNGDFTVSGTASITTGTNNLTLNGVINYTTTATFAAGVCTVTYGRTGDQTIIPGTYSTLVTSGSGVKTTNSSTVNITAALTIGPGTTFEVNQGAQLRANAANVPIVNNGTFKVVGISGNNAIVTRVNAGNTFTYTQNTPGSLIMARYYEFNYFNGGLVISDGNIDNTNNFSNGTFQNFTGQQALNITGIDLTGLPDVTNVVFNSGTTYNVTRTSGTGAINFVDASGPLAGEAYDNDNGNPGTLINWTYPSKVYYSRGSLSAGLTTSWAKNHDGTGANPSSLTGGDLVLIIRDGDDMVLDDNGKINALQLIIGEGTSGSLTIGENANPDTLVIAEKLEISSGATLTAGSTAQNIIQLYGNIVNNGTIDLKPSSNQARIDVYGITSQISGNSPTLADLTLIANSRLTAATSLNIKGNVTLNNGSILYDNNLTHYVSGNWLTAGTGQLSGQGTINFNTTGVSTIGGTAPVTFYNVTCSGNNGVTTLNANIQVNGNLYVTNNAQMIIANYTDFIAGNFTVDAGATYNHSAGTTNFNGTNDQTIDLSGNVTFYNLTFSNAGIKTINGNITANGLLYISAGSTVGGNGTHTLFNGLRGDGTCNFSGKVSMRGGNIYVQGTSNTFTLGIAELEINGAVGITYNAPSTAMTLNVNNNVSIIGGYLVLNNNSYLVGQAGYTLSLSNGYRIYVRGADNFPSGFGTYNLQSGSYVRYDANFDQQVAGGITYGGLELYATTGVATTKTATGNIVVLNNLDFLNGTYNTTFDVNGYDLTIAGNIYNANVSTLDASDGGTVTFNNNGTQTFSLGTYRFNNVAFTMSGAPNGTWNKTFTAGSTITVLGNFVATNSGGSSSIIQNINLQNIALTGGNPVNLSLGDFCRLQTSHPTPSTAFFDLFTGTKTLSDSSYVYYALQSANAVYGGTVQYIADGVTYGNILIDLGDKVAEGPLTINGSFLYNGGGYNPPANPNYPVFVDSGYTHRIRGNWYLDQYRYFAVSPPFTPTPTPNMPPSATGTIIFDGQNQNIIVNNTAFNHVTVANTGQLTIPSGYNCNIYGDLTIQDGAVFNAGAGNVLLRGNFINAGSGRYYQTTGTTTFNGTASDQTLQTNDFSYFGNLTVNKPTIGAQKLTALSDAYVQGNVTITTNAGILDITNRNFHIGGNLTVYNNTVLSAPNDTTFITNGSTVYFDGNTVQQVIRNDNTKALTFNNIVFTGSTNKSFGYANAGSNVVDINGNLSILGGINVYGYTAGLATIYTFYVGGDWFNTGTFVHLNGVNYNYSVIFDGANQTISGSTFNTVNFAGTGTKNITGTITTAGDFIIGNGVTVDAMGNDLSIAHNWVNNNGGTFVHGNNTVTFTSNYSLIYSGTDNGPQNGHNFYNVIINKNTTPAVQYVDMNGDLIVENDLTILGGVLRTNANNDVYVGGNFINPAPLSQSPSTSFIQAASSNIYFNNSSGGTKIIDANDATFVGMIVNAPSTTYRLNSKLNLSGNDTLQLISGTVDLNSNTLTASGNIYRIILDGGTLEIDSAAILQFGGTTDSLILRNGTLRMIGVSGNEAKINKSAGNYYIRLIGGTIEANYYEINGCGGGAGTYGVSFLNSTTTISPTYNLSNGIFTGGTGAAYLNLNGYNISDITINNVRFYAGTGPNAVQYNVNRPIGSTGNITFLDATGSLAGANFENDPANQVYWSYPSGVYWTNGAGTNLWSDFLNWSSNSVPDDSTIVYLDHYYVGGAYTVNADVADARAKRLVINNDLGPAITLQIRNGYDLYLSENLHIKTSGTLLLANNTDTVHIKGSWTNEGTFTHNNGTVEFCGNNGTYKIGPGGVGVGKRFYNLTINAQSGAKYNLAQPTYLEGSLLINKGILDQTLAANTLTVSGNFTVNSSNYGVFNNGSSTVYFNGSNQQINCTYSFYNVDMSGGTKVAANNMDIDNDITIQASGVFDGQDKVIYVGRNWNNYGSFSQTGSGTVIFDGIVAQAVDNAAGVATTFNNLTFNGTGAKNINRSFTVAGDFIISGGITGGVNFSTYTITGTATGLFSITGATIASFYGYDNFPVGFGNISLASNSTVRYISDLDPQLIRMTDNWSYGNLTLQKLTGSGAAVTKLVPAGNLIITGNLTIADVRTRLDMATNSANMTLTGVIVMPTGGVQINWGTGTSTLTHVGGNWGIDADITGFNNLILSGTGYKQMNNNLTITGNLDIRSGITFYMYNVGNYKIFGPGDTLTLGDNAALLNRTAAPDTAFPTQFSYYNISPTSTVYLYSTNGNNQILFTGKNVQYGNLTFGYTKTVTHDGIADLIIKGNWNTNGSTFSDNPTTPKNISVAGATVRIDYYTATPGITLTLNGIINQTLYSAGNNTLNLANIVFDGIGTKTLGDGNDVVNISGNLTINPNVTVTTTRNITFSGANWNNNGIFTQTAGVTTFNSSANQFLNPGPDNAQNYFYQLYFVNGTSKRINNNGLRATGRLAVRTPGLTLYMGSFIHNLAVDSFTVIAGGIIHTDSSSFNFYRNGAQYINIPNFKAVNVSTATGGVKYMLSNWTLTGDLTIGAGTTLSTNAASYSISLGGNWINNGTFTYNTSTVTFNGSTSPITIQTNGTAGGVNDFYYVNFSPSAPVTYNLTSPITRFRRTSVIGNNATVVLNGNTLYMGSNVASDKNLTINGTLTINANAKLRINNQSSICTIDVYGRLNVVGNSSTNYATITSEVARNGNEPIINIHSGATIAARYYLIELLANSGLNVMSGANVDATNNFSDGNWRNIALNNARYLNLETDNIPNATINNISFNIAGTPGANLFNVSRTTATNTVTFTNVTGNIGSYQYENDAVMPASCSTGLLRWPCIVTANWTGAISTDWHTAGNWDINQVPDENVDVVIPDRANDPKITVNHAYCKSLTITNGNLSLENSKNLYVSGDVVIATANNVGVLNVSGATDTIYVGGYWTRGNFGIYSHGGGTVVFNSGTGISVITPLASHFNNIIFNNAATAFYLTGANVYVDGNISILAGSLYPGTNNYNLYVGGDFFVNTGAAFMPTGGSVTGGTVIFNGNRNQVITNANFYNLTIDGTLTKATQNLISVANVTTVQTNATLKAEAGSTIDFNGNVVIQSGATFDDGGETHYFTGLNWTNNGSYTGNGTLIFDRTAGTQTIVAGNFGTIQLQNQYTVIQNNISLTGDLILKAGSYYLNTATYQITNSTGTGNFIMEAGTRLYVRGANNFPVNFATYSLDPTSMVHYDGAVNQTIYPTNYGIIYLQSNNTKTLGGDIGVATNLYIYDATLDVSNNNYSITLEGNWNNNNAVSGVYGTFIPRQGEVIFTGSANQYLYVNASANNNFNNITVNKPSGSLLCAYRPYTIQGNLIVTNGTFSPNGQTITIGGDFMAISGTFANSGSYVLNKVSGTAYIQTNASILPNLTINSSGGATFVTNDNLDIRGNFTLQAGTFNGNGKYISLGDWSNDAVTIQGTYIVGAGGTIALGNGTNLVVDNTGRIEVIGTETNLATITHNTINGIGSRYGFTVNGTIAAKYALFEYMNAGGIFINTAGTIDVNNNFSYCTFDNGLNTGCMFRIENGQRLTGANRINDVSFPTNPGGSAYNVRKISSIVDTIEFYNASGIFAGETYDDDPNNLIIWTGPITLTWTGDISTDWNDSLNWVANYGPPIVPTGNEHVIIAPATNQPIITTKGAKAFNLTINNGASLQIITPNDHDSIDLQVYGDLYINGQLKLNSTDDYLGVAGNMVKGVNGSITNNGNVIMNGNTGSKTINIGTLPFYNLTISGTAVYQLGSNTVVRNDFVIDTGSTLSSNNYVLTVGGNWTNDGTFNAGQGRVIYNCNDLTTKYVNAGNSAFYDVDFSTPRTTYKFGGTTTISHNASVSSGGIVQLAGKTLIFGDVNAATENFNVNGTLIIDSTSTLRMGVGSSIIVNSGGTIKITGKSTSEVATVTSQTTATTGFGLIVYGGGSVFAKYYNIEYINASGLVVSSGAYVDPIYNFSEGTFSYGQNGGYYLRFDCNFGGINDSISNTVFNSPISGTIRNVYRTTGTDLVVMVDASGAFGTFNYEYDVGCPGNEDPNTGLIRWYNKNTYYWTGAINTDWFNGGNWSLGLVPDSSKFAIIPNVTNKPVVAGGTARARKVTVQTGSSLTIVDTIKIEQELLYYGNIIASGTHPVIYVGDNWTSVGGIFTAGSSTVILNAQSGTKDITQGVSSFNNLIINGSSGTIYQLNSTTTLTGSLSILGGTLNFNGYDMTVGGNWICNGGLFTSGTRTVTFNATSGTVNITPSTSSFYNVVFNSGNGTGNATFTIGTTSVSTMTVTNNFTISRGTIDLSPDGGTTSNNLSIGNRFYMTAGTLIARAGTINVGENWSISGTGIFTCGTSKVILTASSGTKSISPRNQAFYDLQIDGTAAFRITNTLDVNNNLTIANGSLDVSTSPTYNIYIGGNWTNNAIFYPQVGTVIFDGNIVQTISRSAGETFYSLTVNNTGGGITLANGNVVVSNLLTMTSGNINTGSFKLTIGTSVSTPGNISHTSGQVIGRLERWINSTGTNYLFPVGSSNENHYAIIRPVSGLTSGSVVLRYIEGDPGSTGLPLEEGADSVILQFTKGYWDAVALNGFACSNYNLSLLANYFSNGVNFVNESSRILKRTNSGAWMLEGTHVAATINATDTICNRNGFLSISTLSTQFAIGATNCLGGEIASDQTICTGSSPATFINVVLPRGGNGIFTYTWQYTTNMSAVPGDGNWTNIPSSNSADYTYSSPVNNPTKFVRRMTTSGCVPKYTNVLRVDLYPVPSPGPFYRIPNKY